MRAVIDFRCGYNELAGTLPSAGIRALMAIELFAIHTNSFTGAMSHLGSSFRVSDGCQCAASPRAKQTD
eukprot:609140-Amphidinium_carterae.2